eukprot:m.49800 g.49800  ORF g.49800 m.49800 type:complete len:399 (+) comp13368_c0_seq9:40-1236(+)
MAGMLTTSFLLLTVAVLTTAAQSRCNVKSFGAIGDNKTEDTAALQKAIDTCDHVVFTAPGIYLSKPLQLHSDFIFEIEGGAIITMWHNISTFPRGPGFIWVNESVLTSNLTILGPGTIDGQGWRWWPYGKTISRPNTMSFIDMVNFTMDHIVIKDSPAWNTHLRGEHMRITNVRIEAGLGTCGGYHAAPNTDGINIGGRHIYVADSWIHNGDDCIPTNVFGTPRLGVIDSFNITVERVHCECGTNAGVAIVQSGDAEVRDVIFRDMTVNRTYSGCGMKISEAYETVLGQVTNVTWENIQIHKATLAGIYINVVEENAGSCTNTSSQPPHWLTASDITYRNITGTGGGKGQVAANFCCSSSRPCSNLNLIDVTFNSEELYSVHNVINSHSERTVPKPPF